MGQELEPLDQLPVGFGLTIMSNSNQPEQSIQDRPIIGIIGGGQLARMQAMAAARLGCYIHTIEKTADCPAASVVSQHQVGDWNDAKTLEAWAQSCDLITLENEFVEASVLEALEEAGHQVIPSASTMATVQDKWKQKRCLEANGLKVPSFSQLDSPEDLTAFGNQHGWPVVLKKRKEGYDGKGNATVKEAGEARQAWQELGGDACELFVEAFCPFVKELAIMVIRTPSGCQTTYPVVETEQQDHICHVVTAPASLNPELEEQVRALGIKAVEAVQGTGCFGVEMFLTAQDEILINELAPRVHNSGHYTIEACACSQFENHIRAILDWPLGGTELLHPHAIMVNLLGKGDGPAMPQDLRQALADPEAHLHIYGKKDSRLGRKMGHLTLCGQDPAAIRKRATRLADSIHFGDSLMLKNHPQ